MNVTLVAFKPDGSRKEFRVSNGKCLIGRKPDADLRIPSSTVSRGHSEVRVEGSEATVRDLGSSNGTYLNDVRVQQARLSPGDRLSIGPVVFIVQIDGQPSRIEPITSSEMPTAKFSDARSGTGAPAGPSLPDESSMMGAPAQGGRSGDSSVAGVGAPGGARPASAGAKKPGAAAGAAPPKADPGKAGSAPEDEEADDESDPLSKMISKSKTAEESSVFEFDFFDDEDDDGPAARR